MKNFDEQSDLDLSLLMLAAVVMMALVALGLDGNWPKVVRVLLAALAYTAVLKSLQRGPARAALLPFILAGAVAGTFSALVRPEQLPHPAVLVQIVAAGLVLGPAHWLGLRYHRAVRGRIES